MPQFLSEAAQNFTTFFKILSEKKELKPPRVNKFDRHYNIENHGCCVF